MAENNELLLQVFSLVFAGVFFFIHTVRTKRAIPKVIRIFCRRNALEISNAKTTDELGLSPPDLAQEITKPPDYTQHALRVLKQGGIVSVTEDGKLYMIEEKLSENLRCNRAGSDAFKQ